VHFKRRFISFIIGLGGQEMVFCGLGKVMRGLTVVVAHCVVLLVQVFAYQRVCGIKLDFFHGIAVHDGLAKVWLAVMCRKRIIAQPYEIPVTVCGE
jgi:uncharacterized membrane-anchored protein